MIYHEWPDMLQYMDKNVKIYQISGNIMLLRSDLVNLSIYIILRNGLVNLSIISFSRTVSQNRSNPHFKLSTAAFNLFKASSSVALGQAMFTR